MRELWIWSLPDHHEQGYAVVDHRCEFIGLVADATIVSDGDPAALANILQPDFIRAIRCEMIGVSLHLQAGSRENFWKALSEITVREVCVLQRAAHAARS